MYTYTSIIIYLLILLAPFVALEAFNFIIDLYYKGVFLPKKKRYKAKINKY